MSLVVGIDIGSSAVKVALVDPASGVVAADEAPNGLASPHAGWAEADPAQWRANAVALIPRVLAAAGAVPSDVAAIATTGMVPAVLAVDARNRPLRAAILQNDARAVRELAEMAGELDAPGLVSRTGSALTQQSVAPTTRWLAANEPAVHAAAARVVGSYDWLLAELGAPAHVEDNWALESGLYELDGAAAPDVLDAGRWPAERLVPVLRPGTVAGELSASAAAETGLVAGTPLVVGGADHVLSAYAAGLAGPGQMLVKLGGAGDILVVSDRAIVDARLYLDRHPAPGRWVPNGCMATSGTLLRWFQRELAGGAPLELLDAEGAAAGPGADGLVCLPYLLGEKSPIHDPEARGAFLGLHVGHGRGHLFRACLEGTAYGFRQHVELLGSLGLAATDVRVTNGGARSALWKQVVADVCDVPLRPVIDHPGASLGAAMAGAVGVGLVPGWDAVDGLVRLGPAIEPTTDAAARAAYELGFEVYRDLWPAVAPLAHRLARGA